MVVRNGLLPFNLQLISPIDTCQNVWGAQTLYVDKVNVFRYSAGILNSNFDYKKPKYSFTPTVRIAIVYDSVKKRYFGIYVYYFACDEVSKITHIWDLVGRGKISEYEKYQSFTYNPDLYKVFPLKGN